MWNELEKYKNHFLQWQLPYMKSEAINKLVKEETTREQLKRNSCPPYCPARLVHPHSTYFDDRAKLAYGWFALPKLIHEMCSDNVVTHWRAINSLSEFLLNPLNAERAINEMDIVRKLQNVFVHKRNNYHTEHFKENRQMLVIFKILSHSQTASLQIVKYRHLLHQFYKILLQKEKDEDISATICHNLSEKMPVLLYLRDHTVAFENLTTLFHLDICRPIYPDRLWLHLSHFLEIAPEMAIEKGFFELLHRRIVNRIPEYHKLNMKCFAMLLQCEEGQRRFDVVDGVAMMHEIFKVTPPLDTYEYIVLAFQNAIVSKRTLWRCCHFMNLTETLVRIANQQVLAEERLIPYRKSNCKNWRSMMLQADEFSKIGEMNVHLQLYCLKALRQMGQMPCIKRYIHDVCLTNIREIVTLNVLNECERDDLVKWLEHEIYESDYSFLEKY